MSKNYHLTFAVLFAILCLANLYAGLTAVTAFGIVNFLIAGYIGFRSYQEFQVYSEKE